MRDDPWVDVPPDDFPVELVQECSNEQDNDVFASAVQDAVAQP